ncbi:flippase [Aeromonas media]|uniref:flippase n=1 Tax=Aeromonas media TaxID=651 RepID=UPI003D1950AF
MNTPSPKPLWLNFLPAVIGSKISSNEGLILAINNSGWLLFDKLVRMTLGLLVGAWVARYLGPAQYGELAYVLAYLAFFQAIALLGMDGIVVRDIVKDKECAGEILGSAFTLRIIAGSLCWLLAIIVMALMNGWQHNSVYITALAGSTLVFQVADTIDLWFQSQSQSRRTVLAKLIAYLISNGVKVILIINKAPLIAFAAVMALDAFAAAIGLVYAYQRFPCTQYWQPIKKRTFILLKESWPFILSGLSIIIYMRIDQIMIKELLGEQSLGIYAAVLPLSMLWSFIPMTLSVSLAPLVARKKKEGQDAYINTLSAIFRGFAVLGWLICIPVALISPYIVEVLFGPAYQSASLVLSIIIFCNLFINMGIAQSLWILNEGKSKLSLYKTLIGALTCIVANFTLIPVYGIYGAAVSAVLAQSVSTILANVLLCREIFYMQIKSLLFIKHKMKFI